VNEDREPQHRRGKDSPRRRKGDAKRRKEKKGRERKISARVLRGKAITKPGKRTALASQCRLTPEGDACSGAKRVMKRCRERGTEKKEEAGGGTQILEARSENSRKTNRQNLGETKGGCGSKGIKRKTSMQIDKRGVGSKGGLEYQRRREGAQQKVLDPPTSEPMSGAKKKTTIPRRRDGS